MVRRRSTVRFRKGAPFLGSVFDISIEYLRKVLGDYRRTGNRRPQDLPSGESLTCCRTAGALAGPPIIGRHVHVMDAAASPSVAPPLASQALYLEAFRSPPLL